MTSTKSFPDTTNGGDNNAWMFKGIYLNEGFDLRFVDISTFFNQKLHVCRCIMNSFHIPFEGIAKHDFYVGKSYNLSLPLTNSFECSWRIGNFSSFQKSIQFLPIAPGKYDSCANVTILGGFIKSSCQSFFVVLNYNQDVNTTLTQSQYKSVPLPNITIIPSPYLHFTPASAPLAPNDDGNVYMIYAESVNSFLMSLELYPNGSIIAGSQCNLSIEGKALDIVATVAYIRYELNSKSTVIGIFKNCTAKFETTIMNNEDWTDPNSLYSVREQLMFYDSMDNSSQPFGMRVMWDPHNGRMAYGQDRVMLNFAHYNVFGNRSDGGLQSHTGSSIISLDANTGEDVKLASPWACSHSLNQATAWDGEKFITAMLGDAYPQGIAVGICEGAESNGFIEPLTGKAVDCRLTEELFGDGGLIPGDGYGHTGGRLGDGIFQEEDEH